MLLLFSSPAFSPFSGISLLTFPTSPLFLFPLPSYHFGVHILPFILNTLPMASPPLPSVGSSLCNIKVIITEKLAQIYSEIPEYPPGTAGPRFLSISNTLNLRPFFDNLCVLYFVYCYHLLREMLLPHSR